MARMVRKQIYLTADLNEKLRRAAQRARRPEAEVLRAILDQALQTRPVRAAPLERDPLWGIVGIASSGARDLSERVDEVLYGRGE